MMKERKVVDLSERRRDAGMQSGSSNETSQLLDRLYQDHRAALRAFLWVRTGSEEDREDIIQEVFFRLARTDNLAEKVPPEASSTRSFLIKIANNLVLDNERRKATRYSYLETEQDHLQEQSINQVTPEESLIVGRDLEQAKAAILQLKPKCREVFVLNRFGNKSYKEIAARLGVSSKQIEKYMQQAMAHLRQAAAKIRSME